MREHDTDPLSMNTATNPLTWALVLLVLFVVGSFIVGRG